MTTRAVRGRTTAWTLLGLTIVAAAPALVLTVSSPGFDRYRDESGTGGCFQCHGAFSGPMSPGGNTFPFDDKHAMHRRPTLMNTDCDLCHSDGDDNNPFTGFSNGTANTPGRGCAGCHGRTYGAPFNDDKGAGLRQVHARAGIEFCLGCHSNDPPVLPESVAPAYYGSPDTNVDDPCNGAPLFGESWTLNDQRGLDNDGDGLYDGDDPDCGGAPPCPEDTNGDDVVDVVDLVAVILDWGTDGTANGGDVDGSGLVDVADLTAVILAWGGCPIP